MGLEDYHPHPRLVWDWTIEDCEIMAKVFRYHTAEVYRWTWDLISDDRRDAAIMNALGSKAGLPYKAKLVALRLEGVVFGETIEQKETCKTL